MMNDVIHHELLNMAILGKVINVTPPLSRDQGLSNSSSLAPATAERGGTFLSKSSRISRRDLFSSTLNDPPPGGSEVQ